MKRDIPLLASRSTITDPDNYIKWVLIDVLALSAADISHHSNLSRDTVSKILNKRYTSLRAYTELLVLAQKLESHLKTLRPKRRTEKALLRAHLLILAEFQEHMHDLRSHQGEAYVPLVEKCTRVLRFEFRELVILRSDDLERIHKDYGFSKPTMHAAANKMGVKKSSAGFGKNKRAIWRLPDDKQAQLKRMKR